MGVLVNVQVLPVTTSACPHTKSDLELSRSATSQTAQTVFRLLRRLPREPLFPVLAAEGPTALPTGLRPSRVIVPVFEAPKVELLPHATESIPGFGCVSMIRGGGGTDAHDVERVCFAASLGHGR